MLKEALADLKLVEQAVVDGAARSLAQSVSRDFASCMTQP